MRRPSSAQKAKPGDVFRFASAMPGRGTADFCRVSPVAFAIDGDEQRFEWLQPRRWRHRVNGVQAQLLQEIPPEGPWIALLNPLTGYLVLLPLEGNEYFVRAEGGALSKIAAATLAREAGDYRIELRGDKPTVGELRSPNKLLPNAYHCLCGYDLRRIPPTGLGLGVREGQKQQIFQALDQESEGNEIVDDNHVVQHGVTFNTIITDRSTEVTNTIATESDYTEAWGVGVSIMAGDEKTLQGGGKVSYRQVRQESRGREEICSYAARITVVYELLVDPFIVRLRPEFREAVLRDLLPDDEDYRGAATSYAAALGRYQDALRQPAQEFASPKTYWKAVYDAAAEAEAAQLILKAQPPYVAALRFVNSWGTHYAARLTYGQVAHPVLFP